MADVIPDRLGRYRIERALGSGGMGEVYLAHDTQLDRPVAIKGLPHDRATPERRERLRREALSAAALSHPAIAHVYEIVTEGANDWVVMEYVEGRSLAELLSQGPLHAGEVARIGEEIAAALADAHRHGIIHRDIKPENVMVTASGHVKVLDFGLAKWTGTRATPDDSITSDGLVVGTAKAMSPEQALGRPLDHRTDIFSLGSLLYEAATGKPAFRGTTPMETMVKVSRGEFQPIREAQPALPEQLAAVIERCMVVRPSGRYGSAQAVVDALRPIGRSSALTTALRAPTLLTGLYRRARRHWAWTVTVAVSLALAAVLAVRLGWVGGHRLITVAVLPAAAQAPGDGARLASAAVTDAIGAHLARLDGLSVISGREVRAAAKEGRKATEIARELGADEIVESSLTQAQAGGPARIALSRVEGESGRVVWSQDLEVGTDDLLLLEDRITTALAAGYRGFSTARGSPPREASAAALADYLEERARADAGRSSKGVVEEIALLERAVRDSPRFLEAIVRLAYLHRYRFDALRDPRELQLARELADRARNLAPSDPSVAVLDIELAIAAGEPAEAERRARALAAEYPGLGAAWSWLGVALQRQQRFAEAESALRRAIALQPSWLTVFNLADVYRSQGDTAAARTTIERVLARAPDNVTLLSRLGTIELEAGSYSRGEQLCSRCVQLRGSALDYNNLATALFYQHRFAEAAATYEKAIALAPMKAAYISNLGDAYYWGNRPEEARAAYARALALCDELRAKGVDDVSLKRTRALALAHLGRGPEAVLESQAALQADTKGAYTAFVAAAVAALNGDSQSSLAWTRRARELKAPPEWFAGPEFGALRQSPEFNTLVSAGR